ncbi:hypothetical protein KC19_1G208000 [Ceratodon purpureus]|uniref:Secreted protein n=1 Tax=Ceratodon purpureus TaxID=3225 RepID=A0A8T0JAY8_CERPU|nr:hypothetical protein KC19_1G208000 [Ceratodon purpureus]
MHAPPTTRRQCPPSIVRIFLLLSAARTCEGTGLIERSFEVLAVQCRSLVHMKGWSRRNLLTQRLLRIH